MTSLYKSIDRLWTDLYHLFSTSMTWNIWNNTYLNCGCTWKRRMIIGVNFQFKQLERRSLKKSGLQRNSNPWPPRHRSDAMKPQDRGVTALVKKKNAWSQVIVSCMLLLYWVMSTKLDLTPTGSNRTVAALVSYCWVERGQYKLTHNSQLNKIDPFFTFSIYKTSEK